MEGENPRRYILCRSELSSPNTDWEQCWRLSRLPGLGSDLSSFNFKLLHQLLVTRQRLHHLNPQTPPTCNLCVTDIEDDLQHAFISCNYNQGVGEALLRVVEEYVPNISPPAVLCLDLPGLPVDLELPIITLISTILSDIWKSRMTRSRMTLYDTRAKLEARCSLLRETRFKDQAPLLAEIINKL